MVASIRLTTPLSRSPEVLHPHHGSFCQRRKELFHLQNSVKFFPCYPRLPQNCMERADEQGFGMHGNRHAPAVGMDKTEVTSSGVDNRKTQLAQGFYRILWKYFLARHDALCRNRHAGSSDKVRCGLLHGQWLFLSPEALQMKSDHVLDIFPRLLYRVSVSRNTQCGNKRGKTLLA